MPDAKHPFNLASVHGHEHRHMRVIAKNLRMPVPAELVFLGRSLAVHGLEIGDDEFRHVRPVARRQGLSHQIILQGIVLLERRRRRHVALDRMIQGRHVRRTLDRSVAAQRHDPRAGPADIAEQ